MATLASPLGITGCLAWCDAAQMTGLADGTAIASWTDFSGGTPHPLIQATGGAQPQIKLGIQNGLPGIRFDGTNDIMSAAVTDDSTLTLVCVMKKRSAPSGTTMTFFGTEDAVAGPHHLGSQTSVGSGFIYYPNPSFSAVDVGGTPATAQICALRYNSTASMDYFLEGARKGNLDPEDNYGSMNSIYVGGNVDNGGEFSDLDVFEVILYDSALTDAQMGDLTAYLGLKWGITGYGATMVATRASGGNITTSTSLSVPMATAGAIVVGNDLMLFVATDNSGASGALPTFSISDPRGNVWTLVRSQKVGTVAATGVGGFWYRCTVTVPYVNADALTITLSPTTIAKAFLVEEWTRLGTISVAATDATGTSTAPSIAKTPLAAGETVVGVTFVEGPVGDTYTIDSDTTAGWWQPVDRVGSGGTTTGAVSVARQHKLVTSNAAQTFNVTITSRNWVAMAASFAAAPALYRPRGTRTLQAVKRTSVY